MRERFPTFTGRHVQAAACLPGARLAALAGALVLLGACASTPAPTRSLDAARTAVTNAEKADAGRFAAAELGEARQKLALADAASAEKTTKSALVAERLAEQAKVEAELAMARTEAAKAMAVNKEMSLGGDALNEEMQRAGDQR